MRFSRYLALALLPLLCAPAVAQDRPRDLSVEQTNVFAAGVSRPSSLKVSVGADRADATYAVGETAHLFVTANEDAYVTAFSVGPTGQVHQLFPNAYQADNHVLGGHPMEIAGGSSGARIAISGPVGSELIKVIASNQPLTVISENLLQGREAFRSVQGGVDTLVRNLDVVGNDAGAERKIAIVNYTLRTVPTRTGDAGTIILIPGQNVQVTQSPTVMLPVVTPQAAGLLSVPTQQPFPLLLAVDKPAYKIGEKVTLAVTSLQACYLSVLDVTTSGTVRVLFPNQVNQNNSVMASQTVLVSGGASPVSLQVSGPVGTEQILAICSTDQTPILAHKIDLAQLFPPAGERSDVMRDLSVVANRPPSSTSFASAAFAVQP